MSLDAGSAAPEVSSSTLMTKSLQARAVASLSHPDYTNKTYLGCYNLTGTDPVDQRRYPLIRPDSVDFLFVYNNNTNASSPGYTGLTQEVCINACRGAAGETGYKFFSLYWQAADPNNPATLLCTCSDGKLGYPVTSNATGCGLPCPGNQTESCGDYGNALLYRNDAYVSHTVSSSALLSRTSAVANSVASSTPTSTALTHYNANNATYVGCYNLTGYDAASGMNNSVYGSKASNPPGRWYYNSTDTTAYPAVSVSLTQEVCIQRCQNVGGRVYKYAFIFWQTPEGTRLGPMNCYCSLGYGYPQPVDKPNDCVLRCSGNTTQSCGDYGNAIVYRNNFYVEPVSSSMISSVASSSAAAAISAIPSSATAGSTVSQSPAAPVGSSAAGSTALSSILSSPAVLATSSAVGFSNQASSSATKRAEVRPRFPTLHVKKSVLCKYVCLFDSR